MIVHGEEVFGALIDSQTRCAHYRSEFDIIAIKFKCCGRWFPCRECHDAVAGHAAKTWPRDEFDTAAVLCGVCGRKLTVNEYLASPSACPACHNSFNPGCANHHDLYFEI